MKRITFIVFLFCCLSLGGFAGLAIGSVIEGLWILAFYFVLATLLAVQITRRARHNWLEQIRLHRQQPPTP